MMSMVEAVKAIRQNKARRNIVTVLNSISIVRIRRVAAEMGVKLHRSIRRKAEIISAFVPAFWAVFAAEISATESNDWQFQGRLWQSKKGDVRIYCNVWTAEGKPVIADVYMDMVSGAVVFRYIKNGNWAEVVKAAFAA